MKKNRQQNNQDGQGSNQALHYALMSSLKTGDLILDSVLKVFLPALLILVDIICKLFDPTPVTIWFGGFFKGKREYSRNLVYDLSTDYVVGIFRSTNYVRFYDLVNLV